MTPAPLDETESLHEASPTEASCGLQQRIIQIHPTLTCNLRCTHCYSNSAPTMKTSLPIELLCQALTDAAALGYRTVAVSGGEPLVYKGLAEVLTHARACGLRTTVTTNGTLLDQGHLAPLRNCLDLLAISLDGPPEIHNEVRQSPHAFSRLVAGLDEVRATGFPFGFIHTLTQQSWIHLLWTAEFAAAAGATLLQLHPLELTGRAAALMRGAEPDDDMLTRVYLLSLALTHKYHGQMMVQFDAFHKNDLLNDPGLVYATALDPAQLSGLAADLLGLLVVEADGAVVPISYGFAKAYQICNLYDGSLAAAWPTYVQKGYPAFRRLCREIFTEIADPSDLPFFDWHELVVARSHTLGHPVPMPSV